MLTLKVKDQARAASKWRDAEKTRLQTRTTVARFMPSPPRRTQRLVAAAGPHTLAPLAAAAPSLSPAAERGRAVVQSQAHHQVRQGAARQRSCSRRRRHSGTAPQSRSSSAALPPVPRPPPHLTPVARADIVASQILSRRPRAEQRAEQRASAPSPPLPTPSPFPGSLSPPPSIRTHALRPAPPLPTHPPTHHPTPSDSYCSRKAVDKGSVVFLFEGHRSACCRGAERASERASEREGARGSERKRASERGGTGADRGCPQSQLCRTPSSPPVCCFGRVQSQAARRPRILRWRRATLWTAWRVGRARAERVGRAKQRGEANDRAYDGAWLYIHHPAFSRHHSLSPLSVCPHAAAGAPDGGRMKRRQAAGGGRAGGLARSSLCCVIVVPHIASERRPRVDGRPPSPPSFAATACAGAMRPPPPPRRTGGRHAGRCVAARGRGELRGDGRNGSGRARRGRGEARGKTSAER